MVDFFIYRGQLLIGALILIVFMIFIFWVYNYFTSLRSTFQIKENMPVITFNQSAQAFLNQLRTLQKSKDFRANYDGVRMEEDAYHDDLLGNKNVDYYRVFTLDKETLLKMDIDRLLELYDHHPNGVIGHICQKLAQVTLEEVE